MRDITDHHIWFVEQDKKKLQKSYRSNTYVTNGPSFFLNKLLKNNFLKKKNKAFIVADLRE